MFFNVLPFLQTLYFMLRVSPSSGVFPKPLSKEREALAIELMATGDAAARNLLIEHNMRLVAHIVKKYYASREDQDDLISIGTIGLIKGISSFDGSRGARLATYAARCIENEILMYFRSLKKQNNEVSLDEPADGGDGGSISLLDTISTPDTMAEELDLTEQQRKLYEYIARDLSGREREILVMRYGLFGTREYTQREVSVVLGISRSYVSRIEKKALLRLNKSFEL